MEIPTTSQEVEMRIAAMEAASRIVSTMVGTTEWIINSYGAATDITIAIYGDLLKVMVTP